MDQILIALVSRFSVAKQLILTESECNDHIFADIDECSLTPPICGSFSTCSDSTGSYSCDCDDGYETSNGFEDDCTG